VSRRDCLRLVGYKKAICCYTPHVFRLNEYGIVKLEMKGDSDRLLKGSITGDG